MVRGLSTIDDFRETTSEYFGPILINQDWDYHTKIDSTRSKGEKQSQKFWHNWYQDVIWYQNVNDIKISDIHTERVSKNKVELIQTFLLWRHLVVSKKLRKLLHFILQCDLFPGTTTTRKKKKTWHHERAQ